MSIPTPASADVVTLSTADYPDVPSYNAAIMALVTQGYVYSFSVVQSGGSVAWITFVGSWVKAQ
jgi:hypothetical protein